MILTLQAERFFRGRLQICYFSEKLKLYFLCSKLKPNIGKFEITAIDIGVVKGVQVAVCCARCINLRREAIKILVIYFINF